MKINRKGQEVTIGSHVRFHGQEGRVVYLLNRADGDVVVSGLDQHGNERTFNVDHKDCELI